MLLFDLNFCPFNISCLKPPQLSLGFTFLGKLRKVTCRYLRQTGDWTLANAQQIHNICFHIKWKLRKVNCWNCKEENKKKMESEKIIQTKDCNVHSVVCQVFLLSTRKSEEMFGRRLLISNWPPWCIWNRRGMTSVDWRQTTAVAKDICASLQY